MTGASWVNPNFETQNGTSYKTSIDNCITLCEHMCRAFAPRELDTPIMKVWVDSGYFFRASSGTLTSCAAAVSPLFVAPTTDTRIDRLVIGTTVGTLSIVKGVCGAGVPSAITAGKFPICYVTLTVGHTAIVDTNITDERVSTVLQTGSQDSGPHGMVMFTSSGNWTAPANMTTAYLTGTGGGGGGAGCSTTYPYGAGGGAGTQIIKSAVTVTPTYVYSITINSAGAGGAPGNNGTTGGAVGMSSGSRVVVLLAGGLYGGINGGKQILLGASSATLFMGSDGYGNTFGVGGPGGLGSISSTLAGRNGAGYGGGGGGAAGHGDASGGAGSNGMLIIEW